MNFYVTAIPFLNVEDKGTQMLCYIPCVRQIQNHILAGEATVPPNQTTNKNLYKTE